MRVLTLSGCAVFAGIGVLGVFSGHGEAEAQKAKTRKKVTVAELAKHKIEADCWVSVSGGVYNLTGFLSKHKGGAGRISPFCGNDAIIVFLKQHGLKPQSRQPSKPTRLASLTVL